MIVSFYSSGYVFERIMLDYNYFHELYKNDRYVNFGFVDNVIRYITTSGSFYKISEDKVEFEGARNSLLSGCGLCTISNTETGPMIFISYYDNVIKEKLMLVEYISRFKDELNWFQSYGDNSFTNTMEKQIQIINNAVSNKYFDSIFKTEEYRRGY